MKKYRCFDPVYGQGISDRIAYYQKLGVASGIIREIKCYMESKKLNLKDWEDSVDLGEGKTYKYTNITIVIPTPDGWENKGWRDYPNFNINGKHSLIDMINIQGELSFHHMLIDYKNKQFVNGGWHTVRESLNLEQTGLLFEYLEDRMDDLIFLPLKRSDDYNHTGALGVKEG